MVLDILKFCALFLLVLFAFSCGELIERVKGNENDAILGASSLILCIHKALAVVANS